MLLVFKVLMEGERRVRRRRIKKKEGEGEGERRMDSPLSVVVASLGLQLILLSPPSHPSTVLVPFL